MAYEWAGMIAPAPTDRRSRWSLCRRQYLNLDRVADASKMAVIAVRSPNGHDGLDGVLAWSWNGREW